MPDSILSAVCSPVAPGRGPSGGVTGSTSRSGVLRHRGPQDFEHLLETGGEAVELVLGHAREQHASEFVLFFP